MVALPKLAPSRMTVDEFLDWPGDGSGQKFELIDGEPRATAPASVAYGITQANVAAILRSHLVGSRCYVVVEPGVIPRGADGGWPSNPEPIEPTRRSF
jgi:Uma2 family endonuclease